MINTFRDLLMLDSFDRFRNLMGEINDFKTDLKKQSRRVKPGYGVMISYPAIQVIASPLNRIFRYTRYGEQTSIDMFRFALNKLSLLVRKLADCGCEELANSFQHIYNRLFILLPKGTALQPELFDTERYNNEQKTQPPKAPSFVSWLSSYIKAGFVARDVARKHAFRPLNIVQPSLRLRWRLTAQIWAFNRLLDVCHLTIIVTLYLFLSMMQLFSDAINEIYLINILDNIWLL